MICVAYGNVLYSPSSLPQFILVRFLWRFKTPLTYAGLVIANWPNWQPLNSPYFTKNNHRWNSCFKLSSAQQYYFLADIKNFCQELLIKKSGEIRILESANIPSFSLKIATITKIDVESSNFRYFFRLSIKNQEYFLLVLVCCLVNFRHFN